MLPLKYFTSCHWHRSPFHPKLSRIQQVPGPPSPPASHAWTAHQTSLSPSLSHPHYSPGIEAEIRGEMVLMCQTNVYVISKPATQPHDRYLSIPQVGDIVSFQQEDVIGA